MKFQPFAIAVAAAFLRSSTVLAQDNVTVTVGEVVEGGANDAGVVAGQVVDDAEGAAGDVVDGAGALAGDVQEQVGDIAGDATDAAGELAAAAGESAGEGEGSGATASRNLGVTALLAAMIGSQFLN